MFKKTLAGLAVAGLFSGAAMAADVNVYGVVDLGLMYNHTKTDITDQATVKDDSLVMKSGQNAGSRFGLRGSEDLGNGMTVSFKLENGFDADSGKLGQDGRLFGREASLTLAGAFGQVSFGRMGGVASAAGTYDYVYAIGDAFDGFDNGIGGLVTSSRYDNMITYQTPEFAGMKVLAQYSFKNNTVANDDDKALGDEGKTSANRYTSLAAVGQYGNLNLVAAYELQNFRHAPAEVAAPGAHPDDQHTFYFGGNYDFGVTKVFALGQAFQNARELNNLGALGEEDGVDGYGLQLGAQTPLAGGLLTTAFYYAHGETDNATTENKSDYYGLAARYEYSLSKRTTVYGGAGYAQEKVKNNPRAADAANTKEDYDLVQAYVGLKHTF
ncbi:MAG: porin [Sutterella parvirubra]|nr:porin [Sutterella parvirubra]MDY5201188.1 porin [Sutterella parvirubra]